MKLSNINVDKIIEVCMKKENDLIIYICQYSSSDLKSAEGESETGAFKPVLGEA